MLSFKSFLKEKEEDLPVNSSATVDVTSFLVKIDNCRTEAGLKELEKYYDKRKKEINIKPADDIAIRDAIAGRFEEIEALHDDEIEEYVEEV